MGNVLQESESSLDSQGEEWTVDCNVSCSSIFGQYGESEEAHNIHDGPMHALLLISKGEFRSNLICNGHIQVRTLSLKYGADYSTVQVVESWRKVGSKLSVAHRNWCH